jgi:hypothetical protein
MRPPFLRGLSVLGTLLGLSLSVLAGTPQGDQDRPDVSQNPNVKQVPAGVLLVKGAWSSASDSVLPLPEGGKVADQVYSNPYFGLTYPLPTDWTQQYDGPPPSDSGDYVLAQIRPADTLKGTSRGTVLITARDMFFTLVPARDPLEMINYTRVHLTADFTVEQPVAEVRIAGHSFIRLAYASPAAGLHWYVLATQIRCHTVQFVFTSRDLRLIKSLIGTMSKMTLPVQTGLTSGDGGDNVPVCVKDYASGDNVVEKVDPYFAEPRFNPVPVRVIIDTQGKVKHIHFISAFPGQAKAITDALLQWRFKPYLSSGRPVEVETGILFGRTAHPASTMAAE